MSTEWYYAKNNQRIGPFSEIQLRECLASGQLLPTDMVWKQGMAKWEPALAVDGLVPPLPPELPPLPELPPPLDAPKASEPAAPKPGGLSGLLLPFLSEEWRKAFQDFFASWRQLRLVTRIAIMIFGAAVLVVIVWRMFLGGDSPSGGGIWDRVWESGVVTGLVTLTFGFLRRKLVDQPATPGATATAGAASPVPGEPELQGEEFLGLDSRQWRSLLVALFLPTLLASLMSSFLIGNEIHYWLTGPILVILGLAIACLSAIHAKSGFEQMSQLGAIVGGSPVLVYALSCLNARWVLLFYTLLITLPALQLFILCRRNVPPLRFILPLRAGIVVLGLVLFLGLMALPRVQEGNTSRLVGTWVKADESMFGKVGSLSFSKGGSATLVMPGLPPSKYTYSDKTLTIDSSLMGGTFTVDFVSEDEIVLVGEDSHSRASPYLGRWKRKGGGSGSSKDSAGGPSKPPRKDGSDDDKTPNLDSPLAAKLVGKWKSTTGKTKDATAEFTKAGKLIFIYSDNLRKERIETVLGNYSFKKDAVLQIDRAGDTKFDSGWRVEIEFIEDNVILFVNHGHPYGGFGPLAGRFERDK